VWFTVIGVITAAILDTIFFTYHPGLSLYDRRSQHRHPCHILAEPRGRDPLASRRRADRLVDAAVIGVGIFMLIYRHTRSKQVRSRSAGR
jgi:hypothetical protein